MRDGRRFRRQPPQPTAQQDPDAMELRDIAARCESIGRNCEFGLIQRELGLEPISLLRWAGMETADLIRGLRSNWAGIGERIEVYPAPHDDRAEPEWILDDAAYGLNFHIGQRPRNAGPELRAKSPTRLQRLAQVLMETIAGGEKVLAYASAAFRQPEDGYDLLVTLREIGRGPVLIVAQGTEGAPHLIGRSAWGACLPRLTPINVAAHADRAAWHWLLAHLEPVTDKLVHTNSPFAQ